MQVLTIDYQKTFNLGNYSNEKIGVTISIGEGENPIDAYAEAKRIVEKSHNFFQHMPKYEKAKQVKNDPDSYTGREVKQADEIIAAFEANYPDYMRAFTPANRTLEQGLTDDHYRDDDNDNSGLDF